MPPLLLGFQAARPQTAGPAKAKGELEVKLHSLLWLHGRWTTTCLRVYRQLSVQHASALTIRLIDTFLSHSVPHHVPHTASLTEQFSVENKFSQIIKLVSFVCLLLFAICSTLKNSILLTQLIKSWGGRGGFLHILFQCCVKSRLLIDILGFTGSLNVSSSCLEFYWCHIISQTARFSCI